jgi:SAM-dependent methyltransferase
MFDSVKKHFNDYAQNGSWQALYLRDSATFSIPFQLRYEKFAEFLRESSPDSVLDAGCGSGDFLTAIPATVKKYMGIDFSEQMIESALTRVRNSVSYRNGCDIKFNVGDIMQYSPSDKFDFILASGLTEYFDDIESVIHKLFNLTERGGLAAIQTPNRNFFRWNGQHKIFSREKDFAHHRLSYVELDELALKAGFLKVRGSFINHVLVPYAHKFPLFYKALDRMIGQRLPRRLSEKRASMYVGLYLKPD